jgi:hypothetical protein
MSHYYIFITKLAEFHCTFIYVLILISHLNPELAIQILDCYSDSERLVKEGAKNVLKCWYKECNYRTVEVFLLLCKFVFLGKDTPSIYREFTNFVLEFM